MFQLNENKIQSTIKNSCDIISTGYKKFIKPNITYVKVTNAKSYWCNIKKESLGYRIHISKSFELISDEKLAEERFCSSITHELIHTIPGCMNHGKKFKKICSILNNLYPKLKLQTSTSGDDYGVKIEEKAPKYIIKCNGCGKEYFYFRKPKYKLEDYSYTQCKNSTLIFYPHILVP